MTEQYGGQAPRLPTPEEIQDEELWLLDRQSEHAQILDEMGITEKAKAKLKPFDAAKLNDMSRPTVVLSRKQEDDGTITHAVDIRFTSPGLSTSGNNTTGFVYARVAEVTGDSVGIEHEFTLAEAEAVIDMAAGLKQAKDLGVLPYLSSDLGTIVNPRTLITAYRPPTESPKPNQ